MWRVFVILGGGIGIMKGFFVVVVLGLKYFCDFYLLLFIIVIKIKLFFNLVRILFLY